MDPAVEELLSRFPELGVTHSGKVRCSLSGHEMPCRADAVKSYVEGKRFTTLKMHSDFNYASLEPFLIPSQKRRCQLFCTLTHLYVNRQPAEVTGHLIGKKYKKALLEYKSGERKLCEEFSRVKHQKLQPRKMKANEAGSEDGTKVSFSRNLKSKFRKSRRGMVVEDGLGDDDSIAEVTRSELSLDPPAATKDPPDPPDSGLSSEDDTSGRSGVSNALQSSKTEARTILGKRRKRERYMVVGKKLKAMKKRSRDTQLHHHS